MIFIFFLKKIFSLFAFTTATLPTSPQPTSPLMLQNKETKIPTLHPWELRSQFLLSKTRTKIPMMEIGHLSQVL